MSTEGEQGEATPGHGEKGFWGRLYEHFSKEWPSALLVASLATILSVQFHWLKALDAYTFMTIGQLASVASTTGPASQPRAAVVVIDQKTFESKYEERSPLGRCELADQLEAIYAASPDIVVVDIDISPESPSSRGARGDHGDDYSACEERLYGLILCKTGVSRDEVAHACERSGCNLENKKQVCQTAAKTILLNPFSVLDRARDGPRSRFKRNLEILSDSRIRFANGELPVSHGFNIEPSQEKDAIARVVTEASGKPGKRSEWLDTRQFLRGLQVMETGTFDSEAELTAALKFVFRRVREVNLEQKAVVFFGAGFGSDDVFLSAVGNIYGVEAHAAAYASDVIGEPSHYLDLAADFVMAMILGSFIAFFWRKYFDARLDDRREVRELSKLWVMGLVLAVIAFVIVFSFVSFISLTVAGVWLSPVPIAVGMLFDSFVSGSVDQATHKAQTIRKELLRKYAPQQILLESAGTPAGGALGKCSRYLPRALGGEICDLIQRGNIRAAGLVCGWMVIWLAIVIYALVLVFSDHH